MNNIIDSHTDGNLIPLVNYILSNIPEGLNDLEKVRYVYLKLGSVISYDYRIMNDLNIANNRIDYSSETISKYLTCIQISEILSIILNNIDAHCKAKSVTRPMEGRDYLKDHVAVEVEFEDGLKILLDLTLDLYLIQSGMKTKEFGYSNNAYNDYDIISLKECYEMDKKIGYIKEDYTNKKILDLKNELDNFDYSGMNKKEIIGYKMKRIKESLNIKFPGSFESMRYIVNVFVSILAKDEIILLKQYNLSYDHIKELYLLNVFMFNDFDLVYTYTNDFGLEKTTYENVKRMLDSGWKTNSKTLPSILENIPKKLN